MFQLLGGRRTALTTEDVKLVVECVENNANVYVPSILKRHEPFKSASADKLPGSQTLSRWINPASALKSKAKETVDLPAVPDFEVVVIGGIQIARTRDWISVKGVEEFLRLSAQDKTALKEELEERNRLIRTRRQFQRHGMGSSQRYGREFSSRTLLKGGQC